MSVNGYVHSNGQYAITSDPDVAALVGRGWDAGRLRRERESARVG